MNTQNPASHKIFSEDSSIRYRRIVVKVGSRLLTGGSEHLNADFMSELTRQVAQLHSKSAEVVLVSSGAVAAGRQVLPIKRDRKDIPFRQVLASVGQGRLVQMYEHLFAEYNILVAQSLLSRRDIANRLGYLNIRNTFQALLELKVVPIVNENDVVAVDELAGEAFGDNDNLSALVANLIDADLLAILGEVDGLYTADPHKDPLAKLIPVVNHIDASVEKLAGGSWNLGTGGMVTKVQAAKLATASGVTVAIASGHESDVLMRLASGEKVGSLFQPVSSRIESRKRWMLSRLPATQERALVIDKGAASALREGHRSLLPSGICKLRGSFKRGDVVLIVGPEGDKVACGISNYDSRDIETIRGLHSDKIDDMLGYQYGAEVVHRNNMVLV